MTDYLEIPIVEIGGLKAQYVGMINWSQRRLFIVLNRLLMKHAHQLAPEQSKAPVPTLPWQSG